MPQICYITIEGENQGPITQDAGADLSVGPIWQEGHEGESIVYHFQSDTEVPRDPNSGSAIGTRVHKPNVFIKPIDKASPMLWQALCSGENLTIELKFWRTSTKGEQEHYFTIKWENAVLVGGKAVLPDTNDATNSSRGHLDEWAFTFLKCEWTHEKAGTAASDTWRSMPSS